MTAVLKERAVKGETATTTITEPPSNEEFRGQRRRTRKTSDIRRGIKRPLVAVEE
jgi:hypothetical protein